LSFVSYLIESLFNILNGKDAECDFIRTMTDLSQTPSAVLHCPKCGNTDLFIRVDDYVESLVDGDLNTIRLVCADTAFYGCYECHTQIAPPELS